MAGLCANLLGPAGHYVLEVSRSEACGKKKRPAPEAGGPFVDQQNAKLFHHNGLLADAQPLDDSLVAFGIPTLQVFQQALPLAHHNQKPAP